MARNKYPEETVEKILSVALRLFTSQGYDKTSIQDIVDEIGMSKGAIYHHFKSKEAILEELCNSFYGDPQWLYDIANDPALNGLQKLEAVMAFLLESESKAQGTVSAPMFSNARMVLESLRGNLDSAPLFAALIEAGNEDGSMRVSHPREAAEVFLLLASTWLNPGLFPAEREHFLGRVHYYAEIMHEIGIPVSSARLTETAARYFDTLRPVAMPKEGATRKEPTKFGRERLAGRQIADEVTAPPPAPAEEAPEAAKAQMPSYLL